MLARTSTPATRAAASARPVARFGTGVANVARPGRCSGRGRSAARRAVENEQQQPADADADADAPAPAPAPAPAGRKAAEAEDFSGEVTFFEGPGGADAELVLSLLLSATVVYLPLTMASIGRRLWINIKVTDKRIVVTNTSPAFKGQTQVAFSQIRDVRTVPRGFGAWGDMVVFLKDNSRLELIGLEKYAEIKSHIESCIQP
ncbi:ribonuclease P [Raphidocelis subcapitata]|uniref:Ribonuclease P n=1 Tax=Raphidocelis subcapitata TaxID=307507 RepID=A0A2V0P7H9_9CHLO|nr:ribonuclease P [Raphidocelis subcapitata]|eukprot:GBF94882.1 ribonuclease P [Raphidocelis subcapitata]